MVRRRQILTCAALLLISAPFATTASSVGPMEDEAKAMVQRLADTALEVLGNKKLSTAQREARFHELFRKNFNVSAIARFVAGTYWRRADKAQRAAFLEVFESYVVKTYTVQLSQYAGEQFEVLSAAPDGRGVLVVSRVVPTSGEPVELKWRIRKSRSGGLKVVDVVVENISMALTQRQEFMAVTQKRGGKLAGLTAALREKVAELNRKQKESESKAS